MVGGMTGVEKDVIPFGSVLGNRAHLGGLNIIGMRRRGFDKTTLHAVRDAYKMIFAETGTLAENAEAAAVKYGDVAAVHELTDFVLADTSRHFCTPRDV